MDKLASEGTDRIRGFNVLNATTTIFTRCVQKLALFKFNSTGITRIESLKLQVTHARTSADFLYNDGIYYLCHQMHGHVVL